MTDRTIPLPELEVRAVLQALEYYRSGEDYQPTPASQAIATLRGLLEEPAQPQGGREAFEALLAEYWELAYDEGKTGRSHGSRANEVLAAIRASLSASTPSSVSASDAEQIAYEDWLARTRPSGDHEAVQRQWLASSDYADLSAVSAEARETVAIPLTDAQMLLSWMDDTFGNEDGTDWLDEDAAAVGDALNKAIEGFKRMRAAVAATPSAVPAEVLAALDRMCTPLDESWLKGATAEADAHCMKLIRDYVLGASTPPSAEARVQINLTPEESALLALLLAPGDEPQEVTLSIGNGHGGHGLYAWEAEYPEEGATFIAAVSGPAGRFGDEDMPLDSHERADRDRAAMGAPPATALDQPDQCPDCSPRRFCTRQKCLEGTPPADNKESG